MLAEAAPQEAAGEAAPRQADGMEGEAHAWTAAAETSVPLPGKALLWSSSQFHILEVQAALGDVARPLRSQASGASASSPLQASPRARKAAVLCCPAAIGPPMWSTERRQYACRAVRASSSAVRESGAAGIAGAADCGGRADCCAARAPASGPEPHVARSRPGTPRCRQRRVRVCVHPFAAGKARQSAAVGGVSCRAEPPLGMAKRRCSGPPAMIRL